MDARLARLGTWKSHSCLLLPIRFMIVLLRGALMFQLDKKTFEPVRGMSLVCFCNLQWL